MAENVGLCSLQNELTEIEVTVKEMQMALATIKEERSFLCNKTSNRHELGDSYDTVLPSTPEVATWVTSKAADQDINQLKNYERQLKDLEMNLKKMCDSNKDIKNSFEDEKALLNQQLRDARDELEEMKLTVNEKFEELRDYRFKYLRAEQQAEELRRQLDVIELDNKQVTDQIHSEIHKMKLQFQEKLQELSPLPEVLKCTQLQLQESRELQQYFEQSSLTLSRELNDAKEKLLIGTAELNKEKKQKHEVEEKNRQIQENMNHHIEVLVQEQNELRIEIAHVKELLAHAELKLQEKIEEIEQMEKQSQRSQEDYTRSLACQRERMETLRRSHQTQLSDLETQLIRSRALCSAVHKERDELRQGLMHQINSATENFELAEVRLRGLQTQVAMLKSKCNLAADRYAIDDDMDC